MDEDLFQPAHERSTQGISERGKRALKVMAVATIVIVASSFAWMYPTLAAKTKPASPLPTPWSTTASGEVVTYQFVTPSVGWAAGISMYRSSNLGRYWIARTLDGAKHWHTQLRGDVTPNYAFASSVKFFDATHGFVALGNPLKLYRTVDGLSWTLVGLPEGPGSLATFSDRRHGWLLTGAYQIQVIPPVRVTPPSEILPPSPITLPRLYTTDDGGVSWQRLPDPPVGSYQMAFRSPQEGWLYTRSQGDARIYISRDGGQSWQSRDVPEPPGRPADQNVIVGGIRLLPKSGVIATVAVSDSRMLTYQSFQEFTSFDMGRTWTYVPLQPQDSRSVRSDSFEDATHWWATLGASLYKSSDAGQTWKLVPTKLENGDNWRYSVQFLDSKHAWAQIFMGPTTGLAMTSDGGLHWTRASVPEQG